MTDFPLWQLFSFSGTGDITALSGGLLIAVIAVIHVFIAQFAVGGGFYLIAAEAMGHKERSDAILSWVHRLTRFFLLLTMVFGSLTGIGIWLIISLVSPWGISLLVKEFLWAWSAEWLFFLGEIVALLLYSASFARCRQGSMARGDHLLLGGVYCLFAFLSLFIINGILSFMLTPGAWTQTGSFWSAFFNPGFWPALAFRFGLCLMLAGLFSLLVAVFTRQDSLRATMVRFSAKWLCLPLLLMFAGAAWYLAALDEGTRASVMRGTSDIRPFVRAFLDTAPVLFVAGLFFFARMPRAASRPLVLAVFALGFIMVGSFEWVRETARRPWLVHGYMYSNGITVEQGMRLNERGNMAVFHWAELFARKELPGTANQTGDGEAPDPARLSPEEQRRYGQFLFARQCSGCHGINAPMLDIAPRLADRGVSGILALLAGQGAISPYMPPFFGTSLDRAILADWLQRIPEQE